MVLGGNVFLYENPFKPLRYTSAVSLLYDNDPSAVWNHFDPC